MLNMSQLADLPDYSLESIMREKLLYAIEFCRAIDTDTRANNVLLGAISREESAMEEFSMPEIESEGQDPILHPAPPLLHLVSHPSRHVCNQSLASSEQNSDTACTHDSSRISWESLIAFSPPSEAMLYSSVLDDNNPGTGSGQGRLDSPQAWSAKFFRDDQWLQIDTSNVQSIFGVVLQGRRSSDQWVTSFYVHVSTDGTQWNPVGQCFKGNEDGDTHLNFLFDCPIEGRYVRINPAAWHVHPSLRAGVLLCESGARTAEERCRVIVYT